MLGATRTLPTDRTARVLRWTFRRNDEIVNCELALDRADSAYELTIALAAAVAETTKEVFTDALAALSRQAEIERQLIRDGWSLDTFHTERILR